ncbi:TPA: S8 family peptidase [Photobacterium damselae]
MLNRLPILSKTEKYTQTAEHRPGTPNDKRDPYNFSIAKSRLIGKLNSTLTKSNQLPPQASPGDMIVTKMTLHPAYLAKSYFPEALFKKYNLKNLGSKEVFIKPEIQVTKKKADKLSSSQYFIAGNKNDFERLITDVSNDALPEPCVYDFTKFENIEFYDSEDKLTTSARTTITTSGSKTNLIYEVVLHAEESDSHIIKSFFDYIALLEGKTFKNKTRTIKGLTFCFVELNPNKISSLADFSFVRVVRPIPELHISDKVNSLMDYGDNFQQNPSSSHYSGSHHTNIAVFDAGLFAEDCERKEVRYFDLTDQQLDHEDNYLHGSLVTSAIVHGEATDYLTGNNTILNVDHFKVYSRADMLDIGLVDVLDRIHSVIKTKKYKFVNISLGPEVPCPDDEPSLWTSTLDDLGADGDVLIVVAVGNKGYYLNTELDHDLARIQPPADLLNGISIGSANSKGKDWKRASYSCIGPGRRPGYVKPDALYFGGDDNEKLGLITLGNYEVKKVTGTSYSAPLVTRTAALIDLATNGQLNVATIRALLIHSTGRNDSDRTQCGWGLINGNIEDILYCSKNKVTFMYQGTLDKASGVRAAIPLPRELSSMKGKVELDATLCFYTDVDQQHTVSYTRAGIEVTFRPNFHKFTKSTSEPDTRTLFNKKNILGDEQTLRRDAHKWETCYKVHDRLMATSLKDPIFDIKYLTRDEGHGRSASEMKNLPLLHYSLVVTLRFTNKYNVYKAILEQYDLLTPLEINLDAMVNV